MRARVRLGLDWREELTGLTPASATARMIVESSLRRIVLVALAPWIVAVSAAGLFHLTPSGPPQSLWRQPRPAWLGYAVFAFTGRRGPLLSLLVLTCLGLGMASPPGLTLVGTSLIAGWLNLTASPSRPWPVAHRGPSRRGHRLGPLGLVAARSVSVGQPQEPPALAVIALYALNDLRVVAVAATILRRTASESDATALRRARAAALAARAERHRPSSAGCSASSMTRR